MTSQSRWLLPADPGQDAARLAAALGIRLPAAKILLARGFAEPAPARRFLHPSLDDLHDPYCMRGMAEAVERILRAVRDKEKILIYGDYDVDGTVAVVVLKKAIQFLGGDAGFEVPHRLRGGYGIQPERVREAAARGVTLMVSVDTGIRAAEVVELAARLAIDVIVTDHHLPEAALPPALAILNPNRPDCGYPEKILCGAGVAFKLVQALLAQLPWPAAKLRSVLESFLKMVALATVADVVPLTGENRVIVKHGLAGLGSVRNPGLRAMLDVAGFPEGATPSATQVAFRVAPRLNAAGRMDTAEAAVELFLTADPQRARAIAADLDRLNAERQQMEETILNECLRLPAAERFALVYCGENWHRGVLGIVANRLVDRFHRPCFVLGLEDGMAQGSGRSIPGFHLLEALESMPELFARFGGHKHAAGVTLPGACVDTFRERLDAWAAARLSPDDLVPRVQPDAIVEFSELDGPTVSEILALAPFGCGNPTPLLASLDVELACPPTIWKEKHLRLVLRRNGRTLPLKAWNFASRAGEFEIGKPLDVAFAVEQDSWAECGWCATLRHVRPCAAPQACA